MREGIDDEFKLADLKMEFGLGDVTLTSVTSYTDRDVVVVRDASQLTGSVTFQLGGTSDEVRFDSPLIDTTNLEVFSQEVRLASDGGGAFDWLVGAFYQEIDREYGQNLPTPGYDAFLARDRPAAELGFQRAAGYAVLLEGPVHSRADSAVRRRHLALHRPVEPDGRRALLRLR